MASRAAVMAALEGDVAREVARIAATAHAELVATTPVDTSFARSNWQLTVGAPASGTVAIGTPPAASLDSYRLADGPVFIVNHADYIQRLNAGSSSQAPAEFVEDAIAKAVAS